RQTHNPTEKMGQTGCILEVEGSNPSTGTNPIYFLLVELSSPILGKNYFPNVMIFFRNNSKRGNIFSVSRMNFNLYRCFKNFFLFFY
ncbi:MAG: hypothetical protein ACFFA4_04155, partial [Promethearchaeota archaeon]